MVLEKNTKQLILLLGLLITIFTSGQGQNIDKMIRKEVHAVLDNSGVIAQIIPRQEIAPSNDEFKEEDKVYQIKEIGDESVIGYVLSTSAMGRFDAFDYFVVYDEEFRILSVRVAIYRSQHGSAICNKRWLKQFVGYCGESLIYGKDIQAVSGATISGGSIVEDIQRATKMMKILREAQAL